MFTFDHLAGPMLLWWYRAPYGANPISRPIDPGREDIEFFTDGEGFYDWEGQCSTVHCGTVLWHQAGEPTIYRSNPDFPYECLIFSFPVHPVRPRQVPKVTHWDDLSEARSFAKEVLRLYHSDNIDKVRLGQYVYSRLLWHAYEYSLHPPASDLPRAVQLALHLLDTQFAHPLHIHALAAEVGVSAAHLHALFKRHLDSTPYQYLLQRRLQEARHQLASSEKTVKEISFACGFQDVVNFCRCFKARYQITPATYRAQSRARR